MNEYQDIRMEGRVTTRFSGCPTNNGIFVFVHSFFPLVHWAVGKGPFLWARKNLVGE